ncbi:hypothetical protein FHETE_1044 [Fusarium heterosporum]|uniref:RING-type domain-containing protein n=1 Tax=Fusarium heterosporum TaxID=42747 RepID=A0A8H5TXY9_FUSHE|nr:hypothetical protein FHETE_1044 [Fusarium heterosporum]
MEEPDDNKETTVPLQDGCIQEVTKLFPEICLDYLQSIAEPLGFDPERVIDYVLDLEESGQAYTKRSKQTTGKRKREADGQDDEPEDKVLQARRKYINPHRPPVDKNSPQVTVMKEMIAGDFPLVPIKDIRQLLAEHNHHLLPTFTAIDNASSRAQNGPLPWRYKKTPSKQSAKYKADNIDRSIQSSSIDWEKDLMDELQAARLIQSDRTEKERVKALAEDVERRNFEDAEAKGELTECGCCFVDIPQNRLVHCDGDVTHSFCVDCTRRNAETQVGLEKYQMECLSTDGCEAGFSHRERKKFLSGELTLALDRIEQEANIRMAGLSDLAQCPFCPYAEVYPSTDVNREFRCQNPDCGITSCRLCKLETHIPKSCEEASLDRGVDMRREVEEAMSEALIRTCNKCNTPFIKESGCNKMTCTRQGCRNVQCYVCSKSCDYKHFNDVNRGGKEGNCPLFDSVEERHENDIRGAEEAARKKILDANPDLEPDLLMFRLSEEVKKDDNIRKQRAERWNRAHPDHVRLRDFPAADHLEIIHRELQAHQEVRDQQQQQHQLRLQQQQQQQQQAMQQAMQQVMQRQAMQNLRKHHLENEVGQLLENKQKVVLAPNAVPIVPWVPPPHPLPLYQPLQLPQQQQLPLQQQQQQQQLLQQLPQQQQVVPPDPQGQAAFPALFPYQHQPFPDNGGQYNGQF